MCERRIPVAVAVLMLLSGAGCATGPQPEAISSSWEYLISDGQQDARNLYSSVVQITTGRGTCSGVLAQRRLVFTAAHCLCLPSALAPGRVYRYQQGGGVTRTGTVKLACEEHAAVTAVLYGRVRVDGVNPQPTPETRTQQGSVRIHPGYEFSTAAEGGVAYSLMDLAAIHLEKPFDDIRVDGQLPTREVQPEEVLTAAGYGSSSSGTQGTRSFGANKVMEINIMVGGDGMFAFRGQGAQGRGAHATRGDSGGPCFREDTRGNRWLVGIITTGRVVNGMRVSAFTSTFHHRTRSRVSER
ncbi:MAG: trypsin-like serine protease [Myxococcaceae bacterium]|nr:trypsin-like serine protease [Myxococcaceae bacterium]